MKPFAAAVRRLVHRCAALMRRPRADRSSTVRSPASRPASRSLHRRCLAPMPRSLRRAARSAASRKPRSTSANARSFAGSRKRSGTSPTRSIAVAQPGSSPSRAVLTLRRRLGAAHHDLQRRRRLCCGRCAVSRKPIAWWRSTSAGASRRCRGHVSGYLDGARARRRVGLATLVSTRR